MIYSHEWLERHGRKFVTEDEWRNLDKLSAAAEFAEADWQRAEAKRQQAKESGNASKYERATAAVLAAAALRDAAREAMVTAGNALAEKQERLRKEADAKIMAEAVAASLVQAEHPPRIRVRKPKARKPLTPLRHAGQVVWPSEKMGCKALLPVMVDKDGMTIVVTKGGKKLKLAFRESGRELLDKLLTAYGNADGWVELPKEADGKRKKISNLLPPPTAKLIQHETRTDFGGGYTGRVRLWVVDK